MRTLYFVAVVSIFFFVLLVAEVLVVIQYKVLVVTSGYTRSVVQTLNRVRIFEILTRDPTRSLSVLKQILDNEHVSK